MKFSQIEPLESRIAPASLNPSMISISDAAFNRSTGGVLTFVVSLDHPVPAGDTVVVGYHTADDTAHAGMDYVGVPGGSTEPTVVFTAGESSQTISVHLNATQAYVSQETFTVALDAPKLRDNHGKTVATLAEVNGTSSGKPGIGTGTLTYPTALPTVSIASAPPIPEGANGSYVVSLSAVQDYPVTVHATINLGTATASDISNFGGQTVTIPAGQLSATVQVQTNNTDNTGSDRTFTVSLDTPVLDVPSNPNTSLSLGTSTASGIVQANLVTIGTPSPAAEPAGQPSTLDFPVHLGGVFTVPVTVHYKLTDGTAHAGTDYKDGADSGTLVIPAGTTDASIPIIIESSGHFGANETFTVTLTSVSTPSGSADTAALGATVTGAGAISSTHLFISNPAITVNESTGMATITVERTGYTNNAVSVGYATADGSALAGIDYTAESGTLSFAAGQTTQTITVPIGTVNHRANDPNFTITLSAPQGADIASGAVSTVTIHEDSSLPSIQVSNVTVAPSSTGSTTTDFTVTLTQPVPAGDEVVVGYHTLNGTVSAPGSFSGVPAGGQAEPTLTFTAGQTTQTIPIQVAGTSVYTPNANFQLVVDNSVLLDGQSHVLGVLGGAAGTATIIYSPPAVSIAAGPSVQEGHAATFTVSLPAPQNVPVVLHYSTVNGTAHAGTDFTGATNKTFTIPAGQMTATIDVPTLNNGHAGTDQTFTVQLNSATLETAQPTPLALSTSSAQTTILDSQNVVTISPPASIIASPTASETVDFVVNLGAVSAKPITISYGTHNGTAVAGVDYKAASGTVTIPAGESMVDIPITVLAESRYESNKTFSVDITKVTGAIEGSTTKAIGTIQSSFAAPSAFAIDGSSTSVSVKETDGMALIVVDRTGTTTLAGSVQYTTVNGTAVAGKDFGGRSGTINFPAGVAHETISIPILNAHKYGGGAPQFTVDLTSATEGDITQGHSTSTVTITDNEPAPDHFFIPAAKSVNETDGTLNLTVTRSGNTSVAASVRVTTMDGSALAGTDYTAVAETLTFAANQTSMNVVVPILNAQKFGGTEQFSVLLSDPQNADVTGAKTVVTINENSGSASHFSIAGPSGAVNPNAGAVTLTIFRSGVVSGAASVNLATIDGSAKSGTDYLAENETINFQPNQTSATVTVPLLHLSNDSRATNFSATISDPMGGNLTTGATSATVTLPAVAPTISIGNAQIAKTSSGGELVFTVSLSEPDYTDAVAVNFSTAGGSARASGTYPDFIAQAGTLNFPAGTATETISVELNGNSLVNPSVYEQFGVHLGDARNTTTGATATPKISSTHGVGTGTITDANNLTSVSISSPTVVAGGDEMFTVSLSEASSRPITVDYRTLNGTAASGINFQGVAAGTPFVIPAGQTSATLSVPTIDDGKTDPAETFSVVLSNPKAASTTNTNISNLEGSDTVTGVGTITTAHPAPTVSIGDAYAQAGTNPAHPAVEAFTVTLSHASSSPVTVHYSTQDGVTSPTVVGATSSGGMPDYKAVSGTLTIPAGALTGTINVPITSTTLAEPTKDFTLQLSEAQNATIANGSATGTILNSNTTVGVSVSDVQQVLGAGPNGTGTTSGAMTFTVTLSNPAAAAVTLTATPEELPVLGAFAAKAGIDFSTSPDSVTIAAGSRSGTFSVPIADTNGTFQNYKSFGVVLSNLSAGSVATKSTAIGTILDDNVSFGPHVAKWHDIDGDTVTMSLSKGILSGSDLHFTSAGNLGGVTLSELDLYGGNGQFADANVTITAKQVRLFPASPTVFGDGHVNVGYIVGNPNPNAILQGTNSVDLGNISVDGDLARIDTGDIYNNPGLASLNVLSLGVHPENLPGYSSSNSSNPVPDSTVVGPATSIHIANNLAADATLSVVGQQFGTIGSLVIGGSLQGAVYFSGNLSQAVIGEIDGSSASTGVLDGLAAGGASIGSVKVLGSVNGGSGANSGFIYANKIGIVNVGNIIGGTGAESGTVLAQSRITNTTVHGSIVGGTVASPTAVSSSVASANLSSGLIVSLGSMGDIHVAGSIVGAGSESSGAILALGPGGTGAVAVDGSLVGGGGAKSGTIETAGGMGQLTFGGSVTGGAGSDSGEINAIGAISGVQVSGAVLGGAGATSGSIGAAQIGKVQIGLRSGLGPIAGAVTALSGSTGDHSGYVHANSIGTVSIYGSVSGGSGGNSGSIQTAGALQTLLVDGRVAGSSGANSGYVNVGGMLGSVRLGNPTSPGIERPGFSLLGSTGAGSGEITASSMGNVAIQGNIVGGGGNFSGGVEATNSLGALTVLGSLQGGDSGGAATASGPATNETGFILAATIGSVRFDGSVTAGKDYGGGLTNSGVIDSAGTLGSVFIAGRFGSAAPTSGLVATRPDAVISAGGLTSGMAIKTLEIDGGVSGGQIIAGISTDVFGVVNRSADAQIGSVVIGSANQVSNVSGLNIVAGASPGAGGVFGTSADAVLSGGGVLDEPSIVSKIASVVFKNVRFAASVALESIEAQQVGSVTADGVASALRAGPGNDLFGSVAVIGGQPDFHVFELPFPKA